MVSTPMKYQWYLPLRGYRQVDDAKTAAFDVEYFLDGVAVVPAISLTMARSLAEQGIEQGRLAALGRQR